MKDIIVIRGGGDLATGCIHRLWGAGLKVVVLESETPSAIRRTVSVSEAVYTGNVTVEGMKATLIEDADLALEVISRGEIPVLPDPDGEAISVLKPEILIDATIMKQDVMPLKGLAPLTIALGPGFTAGKDSDYVIETMRGHNLGRIIEEGSALPNTGKPGNIAGYSVERVMRSPSEGIFRCLKEIGDEVAAGEAVAKVDGDNGEISYVNAQIPGLLRGLLRDGYRVTKGFKVADVDPRIDEKDNFHTISDKARSLGGSVLELCVRHILSKINI